MTYKNVLLVSTADWDHPLQTNKQHVARTLAAMGMRVLYVESLGLRPMSAAVEGDKARIFRRLRRAARGVRSYSGSISIASPVVVPAWHRPAVRLINAIALRIQSMVWRAMWGSPDLVIIYSPMGKLLLPAPSARLFRVGWREPRTIYHCVDDIAAQPNMPKELISDWERDLVNAVDGVVTTSSNLAARSRDLGARHVLEQTNVVDYERFSVARRAFTARPAGNVVGFVGAISEYKLRLDWVLRAALERPELEFRLFGPVGEGESGAKLADADLPENVKFEGVVPTEQVPAVMSSFDVAIIPAPLNRYTASMFPMKFFEYMAVGVPIVATRLPALSQFDGVAMLVDTFEAFLHSIDEGLAGRGPERESTLSEARRHTYETRTRAMLDEIETW